MSGRVVRRAYKYRFYPTPEQAEQLSRTFGCVRYVYNRALAERSRAWTQEQRRVTHAETDRMLTGWKRDPDTAWLAEPSKGPLQAALRNLQSAFDKFWRKQNRYPKFKKKGKTETGRYEMDFSQWKELKKGEKIELKIDAAGFAEVNQK